MTLSQMEKLEETTKVLKLKIQNFKKLEEECTTLNHQIKEIISYIMSLPIPMEIKSILEKQQFSSDLFLTKTEEILILLKRQNWSSKI